MRWTVRVPGRSSWPGSPVRGRLVICTPEDVPPEHIIGMLQDAILLIKKRSKL